MKREEIQKLSLAAMFLAIGLVLPFFTGQIQKIGNMLLPMHIPVFLCGFICGWKYGLLVGFITPLLRSMLFGMPVMFPSAISMSFELMTYGFVIGILYQHSKWHCIRALYRCMILAMISGRLMWGVVMIILLGIGNNGFTMQAFLAGTIFNAIPGIVLQLVIVPVIMVVLNKTGLMSHPDKKIKQRDMSNYVEY